MSDTSLPTPKRGRILCRDPRLCRLLETELAYLGVTTTAFPTLPPPAEDVCLLVADGDEFGTDACLTLAAACGCPLLIFGRNPAELPADRGQTVFLRRPFALTALEKAIRTLLPAPYAPGPLTGPVSASDRGLSTPAETVTPILTAKDSTVTIGDRTVTLTPAEWAIFEYLHARPGRTVTREELSDLVGGGGNIVDVYVCRLRSKIEKPLGRRMILTVRGAGYKMEE